MALSPAEVKQLSRASDLNLAMFRPEHVEARVARGVERSRSADIDGLRAAITRDDTVREAFRRSVATSVTGFFRDAEQFDLLEHAMAHLRILPRPRVWSAGCSTGAELWSVAVLLERMRASGRADFLGSDLLEENVAQARLGLPGEALPADAQLRFEVRDIVHDAPPAGHWDVILCRNVAIYFAQGARAEVHAKLAGCLAPHGLLLLGRSERLSDPAALGMKREAPHLYRKVA